ncbi:indole-3-glycerol phosphate synthase TrpC [Namhaeicola litoreus]|uniref:Indole-3-glycerol phosphate synthase n=1 Tax=Namhaeicola litoreus TaxID=1052145 RepID=A0ABW3XZ07_9FLAO
MNILDKIIQDKRVEVEAKKSLIPIEFYKHSPLFERETYSLADSIRTGSGIISEFKRKSPSKQIINDQNGVVEVVKGYEMAGASGISVLTDTKYFGGALDDLIQVRNSVDIPVLRKEFIIDPYQIYEARAFGADAILLIAAVLNSSEIKDLSALAKSLSLDVLLEVHNEEELKKSPLGCVDLVGVNNRNLKTFDVSIEISKSLSELIPKEKVKVSESGISNVSTILELKRCGFQGFLIGENFMKTTDPGLAAIDFIQDLYHG